MATIARRDFAFLRGGDTWADRRGIIHNIEPGDDFVNINFSQPEPNTSIDISDMGVTFRRCNMARVELEPTWLLIRCTVTQGPIPPVRTEQDISVEDFRAACIQVRALGALYPLAMCTVFKNRIGRVWLRSMLRQDGENVLISNTGGSW